LRGSLNEKIKLTVEIFDEKHFKKLCETFATMNLFKSFVSPNKIIYTEKTYFSKKKLTS